METNKEMRKPIRGWLRVVLIIIPFLIVVGLFQWVGYMIVGLDPKNYQLPQTPAQSLVINLFTLVGTVVLIGFFRHFIDKESFRSMGFYPEGFREESITGLALGALIMSAGFIILLLAKEIQFIGASFEPADFTFSLCLFISVAIGEELLMRGYILNNLMKSMHRVVALLVSAILFSSMHIFNSNFSWIGFWNILLAGILLGLPYIYTKRLWLPIALHFSWNFFQGTIFGYNVSGQVTYSLFKQTQTADNIWNGGKFGFEGSALSIIFLSVVIFILWWFYHKKSKSTNETNIENTEVTNTLN